LVVAKVVLDASALLAYLNGEAGADLVASYIGNALISTVNVAEVEAHLLSRGGKIDDVRAVLELVALEIVDFDREQADSTASFAAPTRAQGLSLGDRACLALALRDGVPAVTADRAWQHAKLGVTIELIR
jgi:PIN domain nuclease of toxin-antitoxin system